MDTTTGIISSSTRRFVEVFLHNGQEILATASRKFPDLVPGDRVELTLGNPSKEQANIVKVFERSNCLKRSYFSKSKMLAANISRLWLVCAPPPLFNTIAIDRTLAAATEQDIPCTLIANKCDLESFTEIEQALDYYSKSLNIPVIKTSALTNAGLSECHRELTNSKIVVATGISGVGKSSILSKILDKDIRTSQTSSKTGQGRQTTSSAKGHLLTTSENRSSSPLLVDLPGIQSFGVSHIQLNELSKIMPDIKNFSEACKFDNCSHIKEKECNVKAALDEGLLLKSRYLSFLDMQKEIEKSNSY